MSSISLMAATTECNMPSDEAEVSSDMKHQPQQLPAEEEAKVDPDVPLVRSSSIYSLTLGEIQNTVCEPGKTFGSMNMDEFLTNIWNAEESQVGTAAASSNVPSSSVPSSCSVAALQPLQRQSSLPLPKPLSRKTVDEVWAEIHNGSGTAITGSGVGHQPHTVHQSNNDATSVATTRQPTFGEMTLEDFLIKAGVVREGCSNITCVVASGMPSTPRPAQQALPAAQPFNLAGYQVPTTVPESGAGFGHVMGVGAYGIGNGYGNRIGNGYGGGHQMMVVAGSPSSPGSPEAISDKMIGYGVNEGVGRTARSGGRKRDSDEIAVEKVVERRQRRMIKNRESAARSRARKQAYTVELEAELNLLKEENARLEEEHKRVTALRTKLLVDAMAERSHMNALKKASTLRRCNTSPW